MDNSENSRQNSQSMIASITSLDLLLSNMRERYCCIAQEGSPYAQFASANLIPNQMILVTDSEKISDDSLISSNEISDELVQKGMKAFLPSCFTSSILEDWSHKNRITIIAPNSNLQKQLEDKIFFDDVLHNNNISVPTSRVLRSNKDIDNTLPFPGVLQVPDSWGGLGTYFIESLDHLQNIFSEKKLSFPLLYRAFIVGQALGVTILVGESNTMFSALRSQLFIPAPDDPPYFIGTQWIPKNTISAKAIITLERSLSQLADAIRTLGFRGMANVDCILTDDNTFIIECNPRQSLCTCQIAQHSQLMHGYDLMEEYVRCFTEGDITAHLPSIPDTDFEGCVLDLDQFGRRFEGRKIKNPWGVGLYNKREGNEPFSLLLADAKDEDILIVHTIQANTLLDATSNLGLVLTEFPIANVQSGKTALMPQGESLLDFVSQIIESSLE
ncbi:ATP-grasp domain-containing protein [Patescibacteria group bacterium]|nr:ATP-grasp domain-containing protein [Patescibacteria group bacterium]